MKSASLDLITRIIQIVGYLYTTLCMTFLVLFLLKLIVNDGSWINYLIIFTAGCCIWLGGHFIRPFTLHWISQN
jgi:uncharacterized membrane protein YjjP (DUF1212 family)